MIGIIRCHERTLWCTYLHEMIDYDKTSLMKVRNYLDECQRYIECVFKREREEKNAHQRKARQI